MQLTNFSYLQSRNDFMTSIASRKVSMTQIQTGRVLSRSGDDVGALSHTTNLNSEVKRTRHYVNNLQNASSFLKAQEDGLMKALDIYERMGTLATRASAPTISSSDLQDYEAEFQDLKQQLLELRGTKYQDRALFNQAVYCGDEKTFDYAELDLSTNPNPHAIFNRANDVESTSGTIQFRVNSGTNGDIYRVWLGDTLVMSMGDQSQVPNSHLNNQTFPNKSLYPSDSNLANGGAWRTSGSAKDGDDDLVTLSFGPGIETTYKITPGGTNDPNGDGHSDYNTHDGNGNYDKIYIIPSLPSDHDPDDSVLTLQIETSSIGIIYQANGSSGSGETGDNIQDVGVTFTPSLFPIDLPKDSSQNLLQIDQNGFDIMEDASIATPVDAQAVMAKLSGNGNDLYGEIKCVLEHRISSISSEQNRIRSEIESMNQKLLGGEISLGRIMDADMAKAATELATSSIKSEMAVQVMGNSSKMKDILIPLTTNHFRGAPMQARLF